MVYIQEHFGRSPDENGAPETINRPWGPHPFGAAAGGGVLRS